MIMTTLKKNMSVNTTLIIFFGCLIWSVYGLADECISSNNKRGVCRTFSNCPNINNTATWAGSQPVICRVKNDIAYVCCELPELEESEEEKRSHRRVESDSESNSHEVVIDEEDVSSSENDEELSDKFYRRNHKHPWGRGRQTGGNRKVHYYQSPKQPVWPQSGEISNTYHFSNDKDTYYTDYQGLKPQGRPQSNEWYQPNQQRPQLNSGGWQENSNDYYDNRRTTERPRTTTPSRIVLPGDFRPNPSHIHSGPQNFNSGGSRPNNYYNSGSSRPDNFNSGGSRPNNFNSVGSRPDNNYHSGVISPDSFNSGGSRPQNFNTGGSRPDNNYNSGGSRPDSFNSGGSRPDNNYNSGSSRPQNFNTGGSRPQNFNSGGSRPDNNYHSGVISPDSFNSGGSRPQNFNSGGSRPDNNYNSGGSRPDSFNSGASRPQNFNTGGSRPDNNYNSGSSRPQNFNTGGSRPQNQNSRPKRRISELKCEEYAEAVTVKVSGLLLTPDPKPITKYVEKCISAQQLIVGGENTTVGEFPHMAALGFRDRNSREISWRCGGTLISEQYVLTAAHCTERKPVKVRLGDYNLKSDNDGAHPEDYSIQEIIPHPEYKKPSKYNDIALLKLSSRVEVRRHIRPACLHLNHDIPETKVIAIGWGRVERDEDVSDTLLKVGLNVIDKDTCDRAYTVHRRKTALAQGIVDSQLCAGELAGGKDTCQGDSGGPLEFISKSNKCLHYIVGVTSFGIQCALANAPGVYTRVSSYIPWIESIVWPQ